MYPGKTRKNNASHRNPTSDALFHAQCQVNTQLVFEYLCGMGETGENFVREALSRPVPDPRNDMRELLVGTYTLSNSFWGLLNFNIDVFN